MKKEFECIRVIGLEPRHPFFITDEALTDLPDADWTDLIAPNSRIESRTGLSTHRCLSTSELSGQAAQHLLAGQAEFFGDVSASPILELTPAEHVCAETLELPRPVKLLKCARIIIGFWILDPKLGVR